MSTSSSQPVRRPGGRRPVPPLVFLLILAILALGVWWKVLRKDENTQAAAKATCSATAAPSAIAALSNMGAIKVRVLNGSGQKGLAASIQTELTARGFTVVGIGNAPSDQNITSVGEIHYGKGNAFAADVLGKQADGFALVEDDSLTDGTISIIPGTAYTGLTPTATAAAGVKTVVAAKAKAQACAPASSTAATSSAKK